MIQGDPQVRDQIQVGATKYEGSAFLQCPSCGTELKRSNAPGIIQLKCLRENDCLEKTFSSQDELRAYMIAGIKQVTAENGLPNDDLHIEERVGEPDRFKFDHNK